MTDKEKIRKEVERLQKELIKNDENGFGSDVDNACILELQNVLTYIDSLQEEPVSNDLEEAANDLEDYAYQVAYDLSRDWLKENATWDDVETAVKLGAQWQKQQLIDKACEWINLHIGELSDIYTRSAIRNEFLEDFRKAMEE